jgi:tRNA pseudouridine13 synthase
MSNANLPRAVIRQRPADFVVEEIPAYEASGEGNHLFVTFRKTGLNTNFAVRGLARALGSDPREAGFAGMKDRHAVTTQTASFLLATDHVFDAWPGGEPEGVEILSCKRHPNKLKTGHLRGNRFSIALREVEPSAIDGLARVLSQIGIDGVPNAYGSQRFGRQADNAERALTWVAGDAKPPRNRKEQRLLFSALQSMLFNRVLDRRELDGSWNRVLAGDLAQKHDSGGMFLVPSDPSELSDAKERAVAGALSPTGPMFGAKMRWPEGEPADLEQNVLAESSLDLDTLAKFKRLGKGTRRSLRLLVSDMKVEPLADQRLLRVSFVLPKGGYATTVLSRACRLDDNHAAATKPSAPSNDGPDIAESSESP